jgi:hypothetical protein
MSQKKEHLKSLKIHDPISLDEYKMVYTNTQMVHRFLRLSVDP